MRKVSFIAIALLAFAVVSCSSGSSDYTFGVSSVSPANGATGVALDQPVTVTFSGDINTYTVVWGTSFNVVATMTGAQVSGDMSFPLDNEIQFTPDPPFLPNTQYTIVITALVEDIWGNFFQEGWTSTFTTGAS